MTYSTQVLWGKNLEDRYIDKTCSLKKNFMVMGVAGIIWVFWLKETGALIFLCIFGIHLFKIGLKLFALSIVLAKP